MLQNLTLWDVHPHQLTEIAYKWCSVICENHSDVADVVELLLSLEIGFRHLNPQQAQIEARLIHTEYHEKLVSIIVDNGSEVTADLLHAWTSISDSHNPCTMLNSCAEYLIDIQYTTPRLRQLVIRSIELIGYQGFKQVGVEEFVGLLNSLHVSVKDIDDKAKWMRLLLDTIQSSKGIQYLSHLYWEWLVGFAISEPQTLKVHAYSPQITRTLSETKEWDKLECWMAVVWIVWPPEEDEIMEDLKSITLSLFHHQPSAIQKLKEWIDKWSVEHYIDVPQPFEQICEQALDGI